MATVTIPLWYVLVTTALLVVSLCLHMMALVHILSQRAELRALRELVGARPRNGLRDVVDDLAPVMPIVLELVRTLHAPPATSPAPPGGA